MTPKSILVTGASSGIGAACAVRLARAGHRVTGVSRSGTVPVAHENLVTKKLDVRDPDAIELLVSSLERLDALVHSAGVAIAGSLEDSPVEMIEAQIGTNVLGAAYLFRAAAPYLRAAAPSHLIHISSLAVEVPLPMQALYCASHSAVAGLCEALRYELEPHGVRITVIAPGSVKTGLTASRRTAAPSAAYRAAASALEVNDRDELQGIDADQIAVAVQRAIEADAPPERMAVGHWHERISAPLRHVLPARWFRKIIASHYRL